MMNYEIFKEVVTEKFMDYLSVHYKDMKLEIRPIDKVNVTLDGMNLVGEGDVTVTPTIYINNMYEHYQKTNDLQEVLQMAASKMEHAIKEAPDVVPAIDFNAAKDNIVFQLVNTEQNKEMLRDMPNRSFQDLSIIYRWIVKTDVEGIQSTVIHNSLAEKLGISEEQMFKLAVENTRRIFPPTVKSMNDVIRDMFMKDGMPAEIADMMIGEIPAEQTMWVISNDRGINGAISMLYEDKLHGLAENLGTDLYIMPSSLHEVIAVSASMGDPNELAQMVAEINMDQVALDERLSNQVYHYDKDLRRVFAGMEVKEAVFWLLDFVGYKRVQEENKKLELKYQVGVEPEKTKDFVLPLPSRENSYLYSYLREARGLSDQVINYFIDKDLIYESRHYHNVVFKGNDKDGITRFASMRGVFDKDGKSFKCDVAGKLKLDEIRLDRLFDMTRFGREVEALAVKLANEFIENLNQKKEIDTAVHVVSEGVLKHSTGNRGR